MRDVIAVINAGSSSIKFAVFHEHATPLRRVFSGSIRDLGTPSPRFVLKDDNSGEMLDAKQWEEGATFDPADAITFLVQLLTERLKDDRLRAIGHRVVHGGEHYLAPVRVDGEVLSALEKLIPLAPLHQPHNLALIRTLLSTAPNLPQIACFDTAFHHTQPPVERTMALPRHITAQGVRRYGFHGLSYDHIASVMVQRDPKLAGRVVVLHLGNGASMCAMQGGKSVSTTMGFTALDGLPMGTRCGALDPGALLYLMDALKMDVPQVEKLLYQESGLLGVSGISSDMRTLEASDAPQAKVAIDIFIHAIKRQLGALVATLGGLDGIVFTAGIGENSTLVRERVCRDAAWLGIELDENANQTGTGCITRASSAVTAWIIPADEEAVIAQHTRQIIQTG